ncbi:MAG: hypothetical protein MUP14_07150 [Dehalococcoidia bacterium]|nr:hypothetical protein [Dehalococcoidia bacterium]
MSVPKVAPRLLLFLPWLLVGLGGSFMAAVLAEVHEGPEPCWLALLLYALLLYALLTLWAAIAVALALGGARRLWASVLLGAFLMSLAFMAMVLGDFFTFAAELGNRQLESYGGEDFYWDDWLKFSLAASGMFGAPFGAFGGFLSWAFSRLFRAHMKEKGRA